MSEQDEARRNAREDCIKQVIEQDRRHNKETSYEQAQKYVNDLADKQDKRKDWNIKD